MAVVGFEGWYREQHPRLVSVLTVMTGDVSVAAEVVDEAFVRAYERWDRLNGIESPTGWVFRTALNALRRRQRRAALEARLHVRWVVGGGPGRRAHSPPADWPIEVWDAMARLPARERTAIALRYVADLSTDEIARAMRIAPGTVGSTLHAARRNLARGLNPDGAADLSAINEEAFNA